MVPIPRKMKLPVAPVSRFCTSSKKVKLDPRLKNPCVELQQYIQVPLFKEHEILFNPTIKDLRQGQKFFTPAVGHDIEFLTSAAAPHQFPQYDLPEVTFIGRSNVGKSSLLQALFSKVPNLVRTSKKPGQTKTMNFFLVGRKCCVVDMPGYGHNQPKCFVNAVETYLKSRKNLKRTFMLIDGKIGFQPWDEVALEMLEEFQISYAFILTKIDKAITSQRLKNLLFLQQIRDRYSSVGCFPQPFMIRLLQDDLGQRGWAKSDPYLPAVPPWAVAYVDRYLMTASCPCSITHEGIAYLQTFIAHATGNLMLEEISPTTQAEDQEVHLS